MEKLPTEIIVEIFQSLHQQDKLKCMLVCRSWEHIIKRTVLFNTIRVSSKEQLNKLVDKIRLEPQYGDRVERLVLEVKGLKKSEINALPPLLSNIREVTLYQDFLDKNLFISKQRASHPWKKTVKVITSKHGHFLIYKILRGDVCPRLTEIQITSRRRETSKQIIELLENAPNLKILSLPCYAFNLMDLEMLHNNVPLLESLSLICLDINDDPLPTDIQPASYMKELNVKNENQRTNEDFINFSKYLTKKYSRIVHLGFKIGRLRNNHLNVEVCMNEGFALFIQQIGLYLTSFEYENFDDSIQFIFPIMDQNGCELKKLRINQRVLKDSEFECIALSKQSQHIQAFVCQIESSSIIIKYFNRFSALTELKLHMFPYRSEFNLSNLMNVTGDTLETFGLSYAEIVVDMSSIPLCLKLKNIELTQTVLSPGTDFFISHACPNLRNLFIIWCIWIAPIFCMYNSNLSYLEIRISLSPRDSPILIITINNNEKHWYTANKHLHYNDLLPSNYIVYPAVKSIPFDEVKGMPSKTIVCKSLQSFSLVNTE